MSSEDKDAQEDELLALASIYDEDEFKRAVSVQGGEMKICVDLPQNFSICLRGNPLDNLQNGKLECTVCFLPPVVLNFEFPTDYPSTSPPVFTLGTKWLSQEQLTALCKHLDNLWEENRGCVVLFAWVQFLKEETLGYLNITSPYEPKICEQGQIQNRTHKEEACYAVAGAATAQEETLDLRAIQNVDSLSSLIREILDFDKAQREKCFNSKTYLCNICFSEKLGSECMHFMDCRHVYCKACLKDYFEIQIRDGQVQCLNCPEPKCSSVATPGQVKELVGEQLFARYDRLLLQSSLDLMADVKAYHGVSACKVTADKLIDLEAEYLEADDAARRFLEQRYGKRVIQKALEESGSREWLEKNSKSCPNCGTHIEKLDGCNKMTCTGCMKHFCWLCMRSLSKADPYGHFNDTGSPCFNRLFQVLQNDDDDFQDED
uniref:E3 ubiquitin-protein ligase rnf14 n=1 Tax=Sphaerodactylus townsendi TaxID=933632 RepID=A0ACB8EJE3_9SAUR